MGSFAARYVRVTNLEADIERLQEQGFDDIALGTDGRFAAVRVFEDSYVDTDGLKKLSTDFGEALFLSADTVTETFRYEHWMKGKLIRALTYTADQGWWFDTGEPEEWEADLILHAVHSDPNTEAEDRTAPIAADRLAMEVSGRLGLPPV
jgi:hypothetical protein